MTALRTLVLLLLGVAACAAPAHSPPQQPTSADRIARVEQGLLPLNLITGEPVTGMSLSERMRFYKVPGVSIALINNGRIEWARGYGIVEAGGGQPVDTATLFQAASISKPVAALAALHLVQSGTLSLDEDVNGKLTGWKVPENGFTASEKVTLRRLLSHTAGTTVHGFRGYAAGDRVPGLQQILGGTSPANSQPVLVDLAPGSAWRYSGGGTTIVQQLISDVTGEPFPSFMRRTVLQPLQMNGSTFEQPLPRTHTARAATGHRSSGAPVTGKWHTYPEMAAAGLWTTPSDLARFAIGVQQALHGERNGVLSVELTREMLTPQKGISSPQWGLGPTLEGTGPAAWFGHGGANEGFRAQMVAFMERGQGAVIMTNSDNGGALIGEILRGLAREYDWPTLQPAERAAIGIEPALADELVGRYRIPAAGEARWLTLAKEGERLSAELRGWPAPRTLYATSGSEFFFLDSSLELVVERDAAGSVAAVWILGAGEPIAAQRER